MLVLSPVREALWDGGMWRGWWEAELGAKKLDGLRTLECSILLLTRHQTSLEAAFDMTLSMP